MPTFGYKKSGNVLPAVVKCPICGCAELKTEKDLFIGDEEYTMRDGETNLYCCQCGYKLIFGNKTKLVQMDSNVS